MGEPAGDGLANPIAGNGDCGAEDQRDVLRLLQEAAQRPVFNHAQVLGCLTPQVLDPLYVGDVLVYPNLGEPIRKSTDKALTFYIVVMQGSGAAPQARLEIVRDGRTLGSVRW